MSELSIKALLLQMKLDENYEMRALAEETIHNEFEDLKKDRQILLNALGKISLGHEYSCGVNEGVHCTCRAGMALKAIKDVAR